MNNALTITPGRHQQSGINRMELLQSQSLEVIQTYNRVLANAEESFTTVVDNNSAQRIKVSITALQPNDTQLDALWHINEAFREVESKIDPARLQFTVTKATDDEICINRFSENGLAKIIINDDGLVVLTFIAFKGMAKPDQFIPYTEGVGDYEHLAYTFFSY